MLCCGVVVVPMAHQYLLLGSSNISARLETAVSDGSSLGERVQQSAEEERVRGYCNRQRVQLSRDTQCRQLLRREGKGTTIDRGHNSRESRNVNSFSGERVQPSAEEERVQQLAEEEITAIGRE